MKLTKATPRFAGVRPEAERFFDRWFDMPFGFQQPTITETEWTPSLDCSENDKEYVVRLEAPGVHKENMDVNLEGNLLTISGHREATKEQETEEFIWKEREEGRFVRSLRLPKQIDAEKVDAMYQDGVLTLRVPKKEPSVKSKIAIK